ncbi:hypothetical protein V8E53_015625 [Lactarius tabidus]
MFVFAFARCGRPTALLKYTRRLCLSPQEHLAQLKTDRKAAEVALTFMTQNVTTRLDAQICKADIPEEIFRQMRTCQTATNEFLRQFWSAVYPPIGETLGGPTTLTQKTAKATRMAGYLTKTPEKVAAILRAAEMPGVDRTRVQIGMQPILDATKRALETRKAAPSARRAETSYNFLLQL